VEVAAPVGRAEVGDTIEFAAEARSYSLVFIRGELDTEEYRDRAVAALECVVGLSDGTTIEVLGRRQLASSTSSFGSSIGDFDAVAGSTRVTCTFTRDPGGVVQNYAVAPNRAGAKIASWVLLGVGGVIAVVGVWLIVVGLRGRAVMDSMPRPTP
jgi:hypothetical protein